MLKLTGMSGPCRACPVCLCSTGFCRGGKAGPNLWGLDAKAVGSTADFKYSDSILATNAAGKVWDEASLAVYVTDPAA